MQDGIEEGGYEMKFKISRTSQMWREKEKPCEEASIVEIENEACWVVEFDTLEELVKFSVRYKEVIICSKDEIEIYDDYRE